MAIDSRSIGGPGGPLSNLPHVAPLQGAPDAGALDAIGEAADALLGALGDQSGVSLGFRVDGPHGRSAPPLDFAAAFSKEITEFLPGAKLTGAWTLPDVTELKVALKVLPPRLLAHLHGVEFQLGALGAGSENDQGHERMRKLVLARLNPKSVHIQPEALGLPAIEGVPGFHLALVSELGRLMRDKPQQLLEFGKLSGWKQTQFDAAGQAMHGPMDATGFAPGERIPGAAPHHADQALFQSLSSPEGDRPGSTPLSGPRTAPQPRGTQRLNPADTHRLGAQSQRLPWDPADPAGGPRAPGSNRLGTPAGGAPPPPAARGTGRLTPPAIPPRPNAAPPARGTGLLGNPAMPGAGRPLSGPLAAKAAGEGALGMTGVSATGQEPIAGGSRVHYDDQTSLAYAHGADARFAPGEHGQVDPRADFGEALRSFVFKPMELLKASPEKFLFLNADTRQFPPVEVRRMAAEAGVDLTQVVTTLLVAGRASQATIDRMCEFHGIAADGVALRAKDQELLSKGANLDGVIARLALDIAGNGTANSKLLQQAEKLKADHHRLAAQLPLTADGAKVGLGGGVVSWIVSKAGKTLGGDRLAKLNSELAETRAQFNKLPLVVQLKSDPRLAMGAAWFTLSSQERDMLANPDTLQQLIAKAADRADQTAYIPQNLTAREQQALAQRTVLDALFDTSSEGARFRSRLGGMPLVEGSLKRAEQNPEAALKELRAKNGESVWTLLPEDQKRFYADKGNYAALKQMLSDPEHAQALRLLREGSMGAEHVKTAVLKYSLTEAGHAASAKGAFQVAMGHVKATREQVMGSLTHLALERALTEVNRQVQEGNIHFVQRFLGAGGADGLANTLGPWVWNALSPAERKLLEDADYRRHLVQDAGEIRATGLSLTEEARQFRVQTENIQQALDFLLRPDNQFRLEFERDPVGALTKRGLWQHLPEPARALLANKEKGVQIAKLAEAVQQAISPIVLRQLGHQRQLENLKRAVKTVNAGNYLGLFDVLELPASDMQRTVKAGIVSAMEHDAPRRPGGPLNFV